LKRNISIYPISNSKDTLENEQLAFRNFWTEVDHPELNEKITYPGPFVALSETPIQVPRRAPLIGEHNEEIYGKELGIPHDDLIALVEAGIV
jgi:crotonobetainyl-CoA:carnitine CoA-transferase CaiB-like acyl-CoA transferase